MTEKEKCQKGLLYDANYDQELVAERISCKDHCHEYNGTKYSDFNKRKEILSQIIPNLPEEFLVEQPFWCDYGYNIEVGENFYSNHNLVILDGAKVKFGNNVFIGPNCGFYTAGHPLNVEERNQGLEFAKPITIGNNVWFGGNVTVLPGVSVSDNSVIGAGSVVSQDIPANVVAVGNPIKIIKKLAQ